MKAAVHARPRRCAVYTRKSTEHNLDLAFTSLDAQREACEAYVASQLHEGWRLLADRYDDGGLSGASLDRPALGRLLDDVRAGRVDVIVVYKVDRLTRSLSDFAKLVELFDAHDVSFVSVTQAFNTTSSMGRLTLNVLLSFAQFEREVIGERVRDKIAASKRKGLWTGGGVPFGYRAIDKCLVPDPVEAETVRAIFTRYLAAGSVGALIEDLDAAGIRPKPNRTRGGETVQQRRFRVGPLAYLLSNRVYLGEVPHKDAWHPGIHEPIVPRDLFEAVAERLASNTVDRRAARGRSPNLLMGVLFDDRGNAMSPSHARKAGVVYRYYVSQALLQRRKDEAGSAPRVPAPEVEAAVQEALRQHVDIGATQSDIDRATVLSCVERVVISAREIVVTLKTSDESMEELANTPAATTLRVPFALTPIVRRKGIRHAPDGTPSIDDGARAALLRAIVRARGWVDDLVAGRAASFAEIAEREELGHRYVARLSSLAFLSPRIVAAIANGTAPPGTTISTLSDTPPLSWAEQERRFAIG